MAKARKSPLSPNYRARPDSERRDNQEARFLLMLKIHAYLVKNGGWEATAKSDMAKELAIGERTLYRHYRVLKKAYEFNGGCRLDPKPEV